jgi:serine phosphatase RsbU (regulator of sigma subunit)
VIRTAETMFVPEVTDAMITEGVEDPEQAEAIRQLHLRSVIVVPLVARGRVLGVMTWVMAESERRYDATDVPFAEDMAQRAAVAIDNAQLYSQTHEAAVRLQRAVLPDLAGSIGGWEVAAHYTPAGRTEVGGDFYDVIELPDGDVAMFLGDVMGRGVGAAAAMAQMRAALRAYIAVDPWPRAVMDTLDRLFTTYQFSQLVTLVYAVFSGRGSHVTMVNAGHPSPLVAHRDGTVSRLGDATGPPLGTGIGGYGVVQAELAPGDVILTFSDGLIERRDEDIDEGMARAAAVAARLVAGDLAEALDGLVDEVRDHSRDDDVAALALRLRTDRG